MYSYVMNLFALKLKALCMVTYIVRSQAIMIGKQSSVVSEGATLPRTA